MSENHVSSTNTEGFRKLIESHFGDTLKMNSVAVVSKDELEHHNTNNNDVSIVPNMSVVIERLKQSGIEIDPTSVAVVTPEEMNDLNKSNNNDNDLNKTNRIKNKFN
jgi:hypothetical protein